MTRVLARHRFAQSVFVVMLMLAMTGVLFTTHSAHAFTLIPSAIIYDPVSLFQNQTLHVNAMNNMGSTPYGIILTCKPTESFLGTQNGPTVITLNQGDGMDVTFTLSAFNPTPGTTRLPITCTIGVVAIPATTQIDDDWSARLISSIEVIDNTTNRQVEILGSRHILTTKNQQPPSFCLFCN